jgi:hypothetical protein
MIIRIVDSSLQGCIVGQCAEAREIGHLLAGRCVMKPIDNNPFHRHLENEPAVSARFVEVAKAATSKI